MCGQGFTRNSSAVRHNSVLHSGQAMIVKPYDYIIGRLKGEFSSDDPALSRRDRGKLANSLVNNYHFQTKNNVRTNFGTHADAHTHELHPSNPVDPMGSQERVPYPSSGNPHGPINRSMPYVSNRIAERKLKLEELRKLLYVNYPPQVADQQLVQITYLAENANDDAYLDTFLYSLRFRSGSV
jgi:hypothetical protein